MPKVPRNVAGGRPKRDPLEVQLRDDAVGGPVRRKSEKAPPVAGGRADKEDETGDAFLSSKLSRRVLDEARAQQEDDDDDEAAAGAVDGQKKRVKFRLRHDASAAAAAGKPRGAAAATVRLSRGADEEEDEDEEDDEVIDFGADDDVRLDGDYVDVRGDGGAGAYAEVTPEEEALLRRFMPDSTTERRTLADIIMEKLKEAERGGGSASDAAGGAAGGAPGGDGGGGGLDPKIVEVYTEVGRFLSHYKSGALPKVFKVIPALAEWEDVLFLTNPETWTPHATYAATRIFASNFNPAKAQRFFNLVLLPKARDDVHAHGRMNFHLYLALKKATYKSAAFYKGILLPLAAAGDCTLREAVIFGSVVAKTAIPQLHSAAALIKLAQMPYSGAVSIFLRVLVNKKYTLPYLAVDFLADHFCGFSSVEGPMPVIWHQALLAFVQRYRADLTAEQKERVRSLLHVHVHHTMTAEVRRELFSAPCRGEARSVLPTLPAPVGAGGAAASGSAPAVGSGTSSARARRPSGARAGRGGAGGGMSGDALDDVDMY